ncbi:MAG: alanine--glyoxylate aminotransferase [Ignavibacteriales bacterium CG_4_9_14_3_um_filter_30_11]|nr:MAG: alanine--glyoxylate aminotransferase [Ignavibacteriales bacterium CG_4_9_14_3_um_filter_30_11]
MPPFDPPKRLLMGPGPSNVNPKVLEAISRPTIGHLDPRFVELMDEIKELLQYAFQTKNEVTFPVSGPGSAGMELCLINLVEPGDKVVVCINGVFGGRMKQIVERCGGIPIVIEQDWAKAVDPNKLDETLTQNNETKLVAFVHAETSTGAKSDIKTLTQISHQHNCLVIADTVTSLGGIELKIDDWQIDASYSGTQKCISCPPGLSPVTFNQKAIDKIKNRKTLVQSWFMDINLVLGYWGQSSKRTYHHTAPINSLYGLHEALLLLKEECLENAWKRHQQNSELLCKGVEELGLEIFVKEDERLPELVTVTIPKGLDEAKVRSNLLNEHNIEIGAGLGALAGKIWRIGLMGYTSDEKNVKTFLSAFKKSLNY